MDDMTTYILVSIMISAVLSSNVIETINDRVRDGQISMDLIRPVSFQAYIFCHMLGRNLFNLLFQLMPILLISWIFIGIEFPSLPHFFIFLVSLFNALIIVFLINYCLGLLAFWYMSMWQVNQLLGRFVELFSGRWIPLWFFPAFLLTVSNFLPFSLMYFTPITIYLEKVALADAMILIIRQSGWIVVLFLVSRLMWQAAIRKLVFQGG